MNSRNKKITLILAGIGKKENQRYIKSWKTWEPLSIAVIKSVTPPEIDLEFFDDRHELINYNTGTDLVAISAETYSIRRAYNIAGVFRKRNIPVAIGGYHASLIPDEVQDFADIVFIGNIETVWNDFIEDLKKNNLKKIYRGNPAFVNIIPDRTIFKDKKYSQIKLVETGRGCCYSCNFCAVAAGYQSKHYVKPVKQVIAEIKAANTKFFFLVDDNLAANIKYAKELFSALKSLKIKWIGQASLHIAKDEEILRLAKESGCQVLLIGFESVSQNNLIQMNKKWMLKLGEQNHLIKKIQQNGIAIYASFVFGFDDDNELTLRNTLKFAVKHRFYFAAFNHLLVFPGTPLYRKLSDEQRLHPKKWWIDNDYKYGRITYNPKQLSGETLSILCAKMRKAFFSNFSIFIRWTAQFFRRLDLMMLFLFVLLNFSLKNENKSKLDLTLASHLDKKPK